MNCTIRRFAAALLVGAVLLQSYFIREIVVLGILFSLLLLMALVVGGTAYLIGYVALLWLERPRPSHAKPHIAWKERSIEP
jgi:hypothetical protein